MSFAVMVVYVDFLLKKQKEEVGLKGNKETQAMDDQENLQKNDVAKLLRLAKELGAKDWLGNI